MLAVIRTCPKRADHCSHTIERLMRSNGDREQRILIVSSGNKTPNENGLDCMRAGIAASEGKPFIFLEDDVEFIADFDLAAEQFHRDCQGVPGSFLPLCANYTESMKDFRGIAWPYQLKSFYGTQAFIIGPEQAASFLNWSKTQKIKPVGFDMLLKDWAISMGDKWLRAPYVSFVQHMGVDSSMHNGRFHFYATWPGRDWRYTSSAFSLKEQANRPCDTELAAMIADYFGATHSCYDMGSSTGKYVDQLRRRGLIAMGFDATPGIASQLVTELDLSRPQKFHEAPGNVMCLEVAEHIPQEKEKHLISNIQALCANKLVLSWAVPGQGGNRHVNEQPAEYVIPLLERAGFQYAPAKSHDMRYTSKLPWFKNSLYVFQRKAD